MNSSTIRATLAALALGLAQLGIAGPGYWTGSGPDGGWIYDIKVHPTTPAIVYASSRGGIYRSVDAAVTWQRIENGFGGGTQVDVKLTLDREAPSTLWALNYGGRLFRSGDGGDNWAPTGWTAPSGTWVVQMADVAGSSGGLYVMLGNGSLLRSSDNGASFSPTALALPALPLSDVRLWTDAAHAGELVVGVSYQNFSADPAARVALYRSGDGGASFAPLLTLPLDPSFGTVDFSRGPGLRRYAAANYQLWRSDDGGVNWTSTSLTAERVRAHPTVADTVWIGQSRQEGTSNLRRSTDAGVSAVDVATGLAPNPSYGSTVAVSEIVLHPQYPTVPRVYVAAIDGGLYVSDNDGASFATAQQGLSSVNVRALAVLPNPAFSATANRRIFAGYGDAFLPALPLHWSVNGGAAWSGRSNGLRAHQIRSLAIDPTTVGSSAASLASTVIYAGGRSSMAPSLRNAGLYKSSDGGASWSVIDAGLPTSGVPASSFLGTVRQITLDPRSCAAPPVSGPCISGPLQTLYATSNGFQVTVVDVDGVRRQQLSHRIIKSSTAGAAWANAESGLPLQYGPVQGTPPDQFQNLRSWAVPVPLVLNPQNPQVGYAGTFLSTTDDITATPPTIASGVFKTTDGGATWTHASLGLPTYPGSAATAFDVLALAIHPTSPDTLWATAVNLRDSSGPRQGYVYKSTNGGLSWSNSSTGLSTDVDIRALLVDAGNPDVLYAAGAGTLANPGSVFKSEDGGASWRSLSVGLPADAALALHIDPFNPTLLYAGTNAAVWQIEQVPDADGDGAPDQTEGNAPNAGDGNGDGQADALQANVGSSIVLLAGRQGEAAQLVAGSFTATVVSGSGSGCQRLNDVQGVVAARNGRDWLPGGEGLGRFYAYPQDLVRFELRDCSQAVVDIRFHAPGLDFGGPDWSLRMYGPSVPGDDASMGWHDLSMRAQRVDARTWRLNLQANAFGSYRPSDSAILFVGGPAFFATGVFGNGFEAVPLGQH